MVNCYLCKKPVKVSTEKHLYDEKLKKRYHTACFAGICSVCDKPVFKKTKHKTVGTDVWHTMCYKTTHNWRGRLLKEPGTIETVDQRSWKAMEKARKASGVPKKQYRAFEEVYFKEHPPSFVKRNPGPSEKVLKFDGELLSLPASTELEGGWHKQEPTTAFTVDDTPHNREVLDRHGVPYSAETTPSKEEGAPRAVQGLELEQKGIPRTRIDAYLDSSSTSGAEENPMLVTPQQEAEITDAYRRLKRGAARPEDQELVREVKKGGVIMGTGPNILVRKRVPLTEKLAHIQRNPSDKRQRNYTILDESGKEFAKGTATEEDAHARAILLGRTHMRKMTVEFE